MLKRDYLLFLVLPLLFYPVWLGLIFLQNTVFGEQTLWFLLQAGRDKPLTQQIWQDFFASLPWSYGVFGLLVLPFYGYLSRHNHPVFMPLLLQLLAIGLAIAYGLTGAHFWGLPTFGLTAVVLWLLLLGLRALLRLRFKQNNPEKHRLR